jgi:hypothetical protein
VAVYLAGLCAICILLVLPRANKADEAKCQGHDDLVTSCPGRVDENRNQHLSKFVYNDSGTLGDGEPLFSRGFVFTVLIVRSVLLCHL